MNTVLPSPGIRHLPWLERAGKKAVGNLLITSDGFNYSAEMGFTPDWGIDSHYCPMVSILPLDVACTEKGIDGIPDHAI